MGAKGRQVGEGGFATGEDAAGDAEAVVFDGAEDAQAGGRVVAR